MSGDDPQVQAAIAVIASQNPDILLLTGFDWDAQGLALAAFQAQLTAAGSDYPYHYAPRPNSGMDSGHDLDGDGRDGGPRDAQGYGRFSGDGGMALLSRFPVDQAHSRDFSDLLWADLPETKLTSEDPGWQVQRLSSVAHWDVAVRVHETPLHLWAMSATPPVFDGPEDRNGRRNHDELAFWSRYLDGRLPWAPVPQPFVLLGDFQIDPAKGQGQTAAIDTLLADARLQDPLPGANTVQYDPAGVGALRVDYVLPSRQITVLDAGVIWPIDGPLAQAAQQASRHKMVWVSIAWP
ncbi:endonuclease/exonuclease/phosphatase family protein [Thioclava sp. SK-1]|uniref:endonuclease/exonuclease/phosphatase family protein n=1 Tax=Thioclava sp. SK-1 TaxID=1889770 RepID=UPI003513EE3B